MNELQITIQNWKRVNDQMIFWLLSIFLNELSNGHTDYNKVKEYHREFKEQGVEFYLKYK